MFFQNLKLTLGILICLQVSSAVAQTDLPLTVSVFNESTSIPFTTFLNSPIHPGVQIGTEFDWHETARLRLYPTINVGYMFHRNLYQGIYVNATLGFDYKFDFGLNIKSSIGLGYLHTFSTQQEFQLTTGNYKSGTDKGNARLMPSLSFGLGYRLNPADFRSTELFMNYQAWVEYPYSPGFIPAMTHTSLHIGSRFYPVKHKQ
jgi:hypothetical protein